MINTINVSYNQQDNIMSHKNNADILTWKRVIENLQKKTDETVTEYNKAQQSRQSKNIKEGTWAIPETPEQVIKLKNLLKNPLDAATALNELGDVFGDDELFDTLEDMKENEPDTDVRHVVISRLKEMNFIKEVREGYKVLPPMDSKYVERDGLEGPFTTLSGKVVYYDPKEGKYYDPDTDIYMSYDEWNAHNSDQSGMTEWVQEPHEGQKWSGQERHFIQELCLRMDGISKTPNGLQWEGKSKTWDEGNVLSDKGKLTTVMSWAEQNKDDLYDRMGSEFKVYSDGNDAGDSGRGQSDGNQIMQNINAKILGESHELLEFGPAERYIRTGNTITYANSKTGSVRSNLNLGGDKNVRVNNHFNADGSQGQVKASGTVGGMKFKASNQVNGKTPKASVNGVNIPVNASKKVREATEYSDKQIKMAFGILNDPRYKGGNYSGAVAAIEKLAKGLSKHPSVANALKRANESVEHLEEGYAKSYGYTHTEDAINHLMKSLNPTSNLAKSISSSADNVTSQFAVMANLMGKIMEQWEEVEYVLGMNEDTESVSEELEYSQTAEEMAKELGMSMDEFWELAERVGVDQYGGLTKDNYEDVTAHIVDNAERYKQVHIFRKAGEFDGDK